MRWHWIFSLFLIISVSAFYTPSDGIVELTDANFDSKVMKSDGIWVVEFYAPYCGHCKSLVPEYKKAAKLLKGIASVGSIDGTTQQTISSKYAIKGYPTIKIFGATDKNKAIDYNGPRTAKGIADAVQKSIKETLDARLSGKSEKSEKSSKKSKKSGENKGKQGGVVVLTDSNFEKLVLNSKDAWMVEFYAPWCGHCQKLEPEWKKAAKEMAGRVKFGALDATAHETIARKFQIQGFPTIKFFPPGSTSSDFEDYQGGRTSSDLIRYSESKYEDVASPPEVVEGVSKKSIDETCRNRQLCIFTFLPSIFDCQSECRRAKIQILNDLAAVFKKRAFGWVWIEAGAQMELEKAFEIGDSGYPVLVAMSPSKMKYATQIGQFSTSGIKEFLNSVNYGKLRVQSVQPAHLSNNSLKIVDTEPWDGKDKELPKMEEIDLSDVDLDEKDEL
ncbi:hypothetical protein GCK72_011698 [Caenorhabditis remanei]|uniref:protein disulfide-isomerase n=1 Tax=Caenorhabditis remanei TaxID=31234 RepID=A0A6A5HAP1_CAERE|nr:hypothetical protein GCK72_011698 [Caenorhabditis remanei]KAF1763432.1 hypothetical protein GCK72_011698 [Caenorhabditis remanei]